MPSILGDRFNLELGIRGALLLLFVVVAVCALAIGTGMLLKRRRRAIKFAEELRGDPYPSADALRHFCQDHLITASTAAYVHRGTAAGVVARDESRYYHALIEVLDRMDRDTMAALAARGWRPPT